MSLSDRPWFAPKRFGYGAGFPIAWQGWAMIGIYLLVIGACAQLARWDSDVGEPVAIAVGVGVTVVWIQVVVRKTRGGWRWRWGERDSRPPAQRRR